MTLTTHSTKAFTPGIILPQIQPKSLKALFKAYQEVREMHKKDGEVRVPIMTLSLDGGHEISGRILSTDLSLNRMTFMVSTSEGNLDVTFLDFASIKAITVHDLEICPEFLENLEKQDAKGA